MATINKFEDFEVWILARELSRMIYFLSSKGEFSRDLALKNQIRSSSGSAMDNIAEGFGRGGNKEFVLFLGYSNGSACETKSQLIRAKDNNYISQEEYDNAEKLANELINKLVSLMAYLNKSSYKGQKFKGRSDSKLKLNNQTKN